MMADCQSETTRQMSARAINLCKAVAAPSEKVESLLVTQGSDKESVTKQEVSDALKEMSAPCKCMVELCKEIVIQ
eukprot:2873095-Pyramimonas_sp.AAC.1